MSPETPQRPTPAFTLIELVSVLAIIGLLTALLLPAFTTLRASKGLGTAARMFVGALDQARTYAITNNTYAWLGIYEESAIAIESTNSTPPFPGQGRVILAIVASKDGTTGCQDPSSTSSNRIPLTSTAIVQVGKIIKIQNVHMADIGPPPTATGADPNSIDGRPEYPYAFGSPLFDYQNRISSDDAHSPFNQTVYPFVAQGYTFYKTVRFNPRGEASINSTYALRRVAEIGLKETHADFVDPNGSNAAAIQFSGISGACRIYQK